MIKCGLWKVDLCAAQGVNAMTVFVCYPSEPPQLGQTIEAAAGRVRSAELFHIETWRQLDIPGRFLADSILTKIDAADFVVADITRLNFNVTFEVGYAIGRKKRTFLTSNKALNPDDKSIGQLGVYDTIGHENYENSNDLSDHISKVNDIAPLEFPLYEIDPAPIFVLDTLYKTDASLRILSRIKKSRISYRSYDPNEQARLSTSDAYRSVAKSIAVVVNLLSSNATDARFNNLRAAFSPVLRMEWRKIPLFFKKVTSLYPSITETLFLSTSTRMMLINTSTN